MRATSKVFFHFGAVLMLTLAVPAFADEATETRLREALRSATEQVQQLQAEKAALEAQAVPAVVPDQKPPKNVISRAAYERAVSKLDAQHQADQAQIGMLKAAVDDTAKAAKARVVADRS